ncbi:MAG: response regulator transcription factor [Thermogemmatispora sp.]|jgi:two-component system response regulator ResD|uniref:DNA-binding response regulator n=1 Tax=Thermogemmatispora aurantia TaxID=2045279 RepID=A0A5J4KDM1_9CHLR|nr:MULTISPECIES: response regulator transcription factor [Thermogemmatispora]MBE3565691.1 response regulator transcription factor [Thermogemmatispora sp.]GER85613.1 DNA-binding response regulator [Thermogemmatispora aurantia]
MKILIIEDENNIAQLIRLYLEQAGYEVVIAGDGAAGLELHAREKPDLVILDLMLPALDGMEVCRRIRAWADTPILMLTARQGEEDRIAGLELGADDYLVKPFSPREVVSRVRAILRRTALAGAHRAGVAGGNGSEGSVSEHPRQGSEREELRFPGLVINIPARRVEVNGQRVALTVKEFDLLVVLASSPERVFTREVLLNKVWGYDYLGDGRTVDVHIGTLRKKIEAVPGAPRNIKTVWGVGYKFEPEAPA